MMKKFNWGWGIAVVYSIFALTFIAALIYFSVQKVELVEDKYYEAELSFQQRMRATKRADKFKDSIKFQFDNKSISFLLPFSDSEIKKGKFTLFRPSNSSLDQTFDLRSISQKDSQELKNKGNISAYVLNLDNIESGLWKAQIEFETIDDLEFFIEKRIKF